MFFYKHLWRKLDRYTCLTTCALAPLLIAPATPFYRRTHLPRTICGFLLCWCSQCLLKLSLHLLVSTIYFTFRRWDNILMVMYRENFLRTVNMNTCILQQTCFIICIYQNLNFAENLPEGVKKFNRYLKSMNEIQSRYPSFCNTFLPIVTINFKVRKKDSISSKNSI